MNKKQWNKYNQNIINRSNGITFTRRQAESLVSLLNDMSNFTLLMQEDCPKAFDDPEVFWSAFGQLCKTCDELDKKFIFKLQDQLNGKRG